MQLVDKISTQTTSANSNKLSAQPQPSSWICMVSDSIERLRPNWLMSIYVADNEKPTYVWF